MNGTAHSISGDAEQVTGLSPTASVETRIQVLPEFVASQIAAGEIVERPASVVKELVDNSLDARGTVIAIDVVHGGKTLIRVTDNGEGMSRADAALACQRFATSKLRNQDDLMGITTYGFRGEALPSIAAISRFRMLTALHGARSGTAVAIEGGGPPSVEERGSPPGTRIEVGEIFFNTPARQKFLKTTATEFSHVVHVIQQAALANGQTHFRLTHNDHPVFDYPTAATFEDRLLQVYGTKVMDAMLSIQLERGTVQVQGVAVNPCHARTSRTPQEIFVNRRAVKNATIAHAVYESYGSFLPKDRHPVFVVMLDLEAHEVDVNVHPSKREVKFRSPDLIHRVIKEAVRRPLQKEGVAPSLPGLSAADANGSVTVRPAMPDLIDGRPAGNVDAPVPTTRPLPGVLDAKTGSHERGDLTDHAQESAVAYALDPSVWIFGQIHATYILAQVGDTLHVLDQHTIHERVLFERLWREWKDRQIRSQRLLIPEPVDLPVSMATTLEECLPTLADLGLELERMGQSAFVIRTVPALLGQMDYGAFLEDVLNDVSKWNSLDSFDKRVRSVLASMACQGAVQAGRHMQEPEMKAIVHDWISEGVPMTCPHGRRISLRFGSDELHRIFRRL